MQKQRSQQNLWLISTYHSGGQSALCWLGSSPGPTAWIHMSALEQKYPPAALPWTPALRCTQPAALPVSLHTPVENTDSTLT